MPRLLTDGLFRRRAIVVDALLLSRADDAMKSDLQWLARFYLIVAIGAPARRAVASPDFDRVAGGDLASHLRARAIETYASWRIGTALAPAFRKFFRCSTSAAVARALHEIRTFETESPIIIDDELLRARVARMKSRGERVVFTNGIFDLLHIGHLRLLEGARALGDRLVVGINSDASTRALKGRLRPVVPQFARAELLTRLRCVDCCCIYPDADPKRILSVVRPDVLAKGADYTMARIVGARFVRGYGGSVARLPLVTGSSTTSTIRSITGAAAPLNRRAPRPDR